MGRVHQVNKYGRLEIISKPQDFDSAVNQEIKGKFVAREVLACFSYEMEAVLRASLDQKSNVEYPLPTYEEIENLYEYKCPECGSGQPSLEHYQSDEANDEKPLICPECKEKLTDEPEQESQEIFEWWIVTEWFYKKLKDRGEPVLEWGNHYWGRTCTGQAILLDEIISNICSEQGILEGQRNDWSKNK